MRIIPEGLRLWTGDTIRDRADVGILMQPETRPGCIQLKFLLSFLIGFPPMELLLAFYPPPVMFVKHLYGCSKVA